MEKLKFGLIGLGSIAEIHAEVINSIDNASLFALYHKDINKAEAFSSKFGGKAYSDINEFLASGIDVLVLATPSAVRGEYANPALKKGIHVLVEKPMDIDSSKAMAMIDSAKESGAKLGVIFQNRFSPLNVEIKRAVSEGRLGKRMLSSVYVKWHRSQEYYDSASWRGNKEFEGGGCLMNQAIHGLDLLLSFSPSLKEVFSFYGTLDHQRIDVEDTLVASLKFEDGSFGGLECSTTSWPGTSRRIELTGSSGTIIAEDDRLIKWDFKEMRAEDDEIIKRFSSSIPSSASSPKVSPENHRLEYLDFIDAIINNREPIVSGEEGLKSLIAIEAIYKSGADGKKIII